MIKYRIRISIRNDKPIVFDSFEDCSDIIIEAIKSKYDVIAVSKVDMLTIKLQ